MTAHDVLADRRSFLKNLGLASAGVGATLASIRNGEAQTISDADIVQFALNLEYLEAEFYTVARTGKTIDQFGISITGSGNSGPTTGGQKVTFIEGSTLALSADQIAQDEREHVALLRQTLSSLGVMPIAKPAINLNALQTGFESQEAFINLARAFEDVGVSAYGGAAPLLQNKTILAAAARILAAEAEHTGNLRLHAALYQASTITVDSIDIAPPPTGKQFFTTDSNGLTPVRTPGQVLYIVYGGKANATSGGFFPNGVNGSVNTSSAAASGS
ncbi:MAG TPA: ferritin-like domain-containing protein [Bryobacteraceae bacterium]|jgi:hypothetical protein|nr:ferritin-like domain-containing protein [Bryobacteraceae bacterium]